jgi:hypothetical protein
MTDERKIFHKLKCLKVIHYSNGHGGVLYMIIFQSEQDGTIYYTQTANSSLSGLEPGKIYDLSAHLNYDDRLTYVNIIKQDDPVHSPDPVDSDADAKNYNLKNIFNKYKHTA